MIGEFASDRNQARAAIRNLGEKLVKTQRELVTLKLALDQHMNRRTDQLDRKYESALLERLLVSAPLTAESFGLLSLHQNLPDTFKELVQEYQALLDLALEERTYRVDRHISARLRSLAQGIGALRVGPRDIIEIHSSALKTKIEGIPSQKAHAYLEEGRLIVLQLMGHLVSHYRNVSLGVRSIPAAGIGQNQEKKESPEENQSESI